MITLTCFVREVSNTCSAHGKCHSFLMTGVVLSPSLLSQCAGMGTSASNQKNALTKILKMNSKILGVQQSMNSGLFIRQVGRKAESILSDASHSLFTEFQTFISGSRLRFPPY